MTLPNSNLALGPAFNRGIGGHHRPNNGATDEWLTPPSLIEALGPFDLDPCSPVDRPYPTAAKHFTVIDNGLWQKWEGRIWLNPPYGQQTGVWLQRLAEHGNGIALIFARTETTMFHNFGWDAADAMLFLRGRLNFHLPDGKRADKNAGGPSVLIAYGQNNLECLRACGIAGKFIALKPKE